MIDRKLWLPPFPRALPAWPCAACDGVGSLATIPDTLKMEETAACRRVRATTTFHWAELCFATLLRCTNPDCGDVAVVSGTMTFVEQYGTDEADMLFDVDLFEPSAFVNAPPLLRARPECPASVKAELKRSFALYWTDRRACAAAIRSASDALLDAPGVPRQGEPDSDRRVLGSIEAIGDSGSPDAAPTHEDLLDDYERLDRAIAAACGGTGMTTG